MRRIWIVMPAALGLVLCGAAAAQARNAAVPRLDIRAVCAPERAAGSMPVDAASYRGCLADERAARRTLRNRWNSFPLAQRRLCRAEGAIDAPSYVGLLTCLQLDTDALPRRPPAASP